MPFYNETGEVIGILAIAVDITDIKRLEKQLRNEKERVEKLSQAKTEFIRNMEHDIRTPFSGIYTIANSLATQETNIEKKQYLTAVAQGAKELLDYCNNILDFSRIESGTMPILSKKFDLQRLVNSIILIEKSAAEAKKLTLTNEYTDDVPKVVIGDNNRLQRILINLVSNAIKFTKKGYVKIQVKLIKREKIGEKGKVIIRFIIQDTGIGIPEAQQQYIYEKFTKLTPSNKGRDKGYGLGLPVVKQLMADIDGEIDVASKLDSGTTFACTIPFDLPLTDEIVFE
jgi:two-component system aerobic respiration control sensor histidine kinase ArcB